MPREDTNILGERTRTLGTGVRTTAGALSSANLASVPSIDVQVPQNTPIFPVSGLNAEIPQLPQTQPEAQAQGFSEQLQGLFSGLEGESAFRAEQEQAQGLPALLKQQQDLAGRLSALQAEAKALPLQIQQESIGRGRTRGGVAPVETARLRENAIQALSTGALLEASRGNIALAQDLADRAVSQKFDPIREEIRTAQANLQLVLESPEFSRAEKNRALQTEIALQDRQRLIAKQEAIQRNITDTARIALENGAPVEVAQDIISNAISDRDALLRAGQYVQSPEAKVQLQNAILDNQRKRIEIQKAQEEYNILQRYGGLTPAQYLKQIEEDQKALKASKEAFDQSRADALIAKENITKIDAVLNSNAFDTIVGPTSFSRGGLRQKPGFISGTLSLGALGPLRGVIDEASGSADDTVALVQQMLDDQFLNKLIAVKARGATFGALSDNEGQALRNAANAIAQTAIRDKNDKVVAYDMSERAFKSEMQIIKDSVQRIYERASGELVSDDEQELLDSVFELDFNPAF